MGDWKRPFAYGDVADEVPRRPRGRRAHRREHPGQARRPRARTPARSSTGCTRTGSATCGWGACATGRCSTTPGIILDDGTVARLGEDRFLVSTTTGNLDAVEQWFGWWLAGGPRDVDVTNVTSQLRGGEPRRAAGPRDPGAADRPGRLARGDAVPRGRRGRRRRASRRSCCGSGSWASSGSRSTSRPTTARHLWDALLDGGRGPRPATVRRGGPARAAAREGPRDRGPGHGRAVDAGATPAWAGSSRPTRTTSSVVPRPRRSPSGGQVLTGFEVLGHDVPAEGAAIVLDGARHRARDQLASGVPRSDRPIGLCLAGRGRTPGTARRSPSAWASAATGVRRSVGCGPSRSTTRPASGCAHDAPASPSPDPSEPAARARRAADRRATWPLRELGPFDKTVAARHRAALAVAGRVVDARRRHGLASRARRGDRARADPARERRARRACWPARGRRSMSARVMPSCAWPAVTPGRCSPRRARWTLPSTPCGPDDRPGARWPPSASCWHGSTRTASRASRSSWPATRRRYLWDALTELWTLTREVPT